MGQSRPRVVLFTSWTTTGARMGAVMNISVAKTCTLPLPTIGVTVGTAVYIDLPSICGIAKRGY